MFILILPVYLLSIIASSLTTHTFCTMQVLCYSVQTKRKKSLYKRHISLCSLILIELYEGMTQVSWNAEKRVDCRLLGIQNSSVSWKKHFWEQCNLLINIFILKMNKKSSKKYDWKIFNIKFYFAFPIKYI